MRGNMLTKLPPELLIEVAKALGSDAASVNALSQVCRPLYGFVYRHLYKTYIAGGFWFRLGRWRNDAYLFAFENDRLDLLNRLLDEGMGVDGFRDYVPIIDAIGWRRLDMLRLLLDRGAAVNKMYPRHSVPPKPEARRHSSEKPQKKTPPYSPCKDRAAPLEMAVDRCDTAAIELLLRHGANLRHVVRLEHGQIALSEAYARQGTVGGVVCTG